MKVLISGAGLVGCHTANELVQGGHEVWFYDLNPNTKYVEAIAGKKGVKVIQGDLLDLPNLIRAMKEAKPAVVVHTAGFIGGQVSRPPYRGIQTNIMGSTNIFEASQLTGVKRVVHVSTFGVYDWEHISRGPVKENFPCWGDSFYHATKIANELLIGAYGGYYNFETVVIRPASVYGPGHYRGGSGGGRNMDDLARTCLGEGPILIYEKRVGANDFVYAKDIGRGVALGCTVKEATGKTFNIGSGDVYTPDDFFNVLRKLLPKREISIVKDVGGGIEGHSRIKLDITQSKRVLGYSPKYPLVKGFRDYLDVLRGVDLGSIR